MADIQWLEIGGDSVEVSWVFPDGNKVNWRHLPPIVFLHHGFGSVGDWGAFPSRIASATGKPCLIYSRRGCGGSSALRNARNSQYLHDEARNFLPMVLDGLGIGTCHLYGHSDGATIALLFASAFPERSLTGVVEAPHVFAEPLTLQGVFALHTRFERDPTLRNRVARHHSDPEGAFYNWSRVWLSPDFQRWTILDELPKLRMPLLAIQGTCDPFGTVKHVEHITALAGGVVSVLELAGTRHVPHQEAEPKVISAVSGFLNGGLRH